MHSAVLRPCRHCTVFAEPTDAKPQTHCRALPAGGVRSRYARSAVRVWRGPSSCRSCMPYKMSCTSSRLGSPLVSASAPAKLGRVASSCNMVTACVITWVVVAGINPQTRSLRSFSWLLSMVKNCCVQYVLDCLTWSSGAASLRVIILLQLAGFSLMPAPSLPERFTALTFEQQYPYLPQLVRFIALASALASSRSFSAFFTGFC